MDGGLASRLRPSLQESVLIDSRRQQRADTPESVRIAPVDDALSGDGFHKAKTTYQHLKTVTPRFTPFLALQIQLAILRYEQAVPAGIPPALRWSVPVSGYGNSTVPVLAADSLWKTNKRDRLDAALAVLAGIPPVDSPEVAINQLACVLDRVEAIALERARKNGGEPTLIDPKPLRLTEPVLETVNGQSVWVSYGIRHVTLFNQVGAVQVQCLPNQPDTRDYQKRAARAGFVLWEKSGANAKAFWG